MNLSAASPEERLLIRHIGDLADRSRRHYQVLYSHFLTPAEQQLLREVPELAGCLSFEGGFPHAQRCLARVGTEEYQPDEAPPLRYIHFEITDPRAEAGHRDVLGSLMGLGIKREMVGDIAALGREGSFVCHASVEEHIQWNLQRIGHSRVRLSPGSPDDFPPPVTEDASINISSLRLDAVCAACFHISRTQACEHIRGGTVFVTDVPVNEVSRLLSPGDRLSLRGKGKVLIGPVTGKSKKDRLFVQIGIYR